MSLLSNIQDTLRKETPEKIETGHNVNLVQKINVRGTVYIIKPQAPHMAIYEQWFLSYCQQHSLPAANPVAVLPHTKTESHLVLEYYEGETGVPTQDKEKWIPKAAKLLSQIHTLPPAGGFGTRYTTDPDPILYWQNYLSDIKSEETITPFLQDIITEVYAQISTHMDNATAVFTHGDYGFHNLIRHQDRLIIIDPGWQKSQPREWELADAEWHTKPFVSDTQWQLFLDTYTAASPTPIDQKRYKWFQKIIMIRSIAHTLRSGFRETYNNQRLQQIHGLNLQDFGYESIH